MTEACTVEQLCAFNGRSITSSSSFIKADPLVGLQNGVPNQWFRYVSLFVNNIVVDSHNFRFITPIFLHAGFIHLLFNMVAQWILSGQVCATRSLVNDSYYWQVERDMGSGGFLLTYFAAGIFG